MAIDIDEFHREFFQDILASADAGGIYVEDAFFEKFCGYLVDTGDLETADRAAGLWPRGIRVDGYGGDPLASEGVLSLIISDFNQSPDLETLTASEMDAIFKRLHNFLSKSLDATFREGLEETEAAFGLAELISRRWPAVTRVRLFLVSNRQLSARVDGREAGIFNNIPVTYSVWDIGRLHRYVESGSIREEIQIDLEKDFGGALPSLAAHMPSAGYEAYLVVIPGAQLAAIYDRWGARLLEQNVRVFLQAQGGVNKGIRNTLENDPKMFFAYNNGITATAEKLITRMVDGATLVTEISNLQIVNGGQTTASIHAASRKEVDLSSVFVQMKLSIVDHAKAVEVVPKISEYANSQNRVNAADFFANHPYHICLEKFSRRKFLPSPDGSFRESKWFYERARGQYHDARAGLTVAGRKKFDLEYPRNQQFDKTALAKYMMSWMGYPDVVSKGAQKNFGMFAKLVGTEWEKRADTFNEAYYQEVISKAIIFERLAKIVTEQPWYRGVARANIVTYAIAKLALDIEAMGRAVNFDQVWRNQKLSDAFEEAVRASASAVQAVIVNPPVSSGNVTEWAKTQPCWSQIKALKVEWPKNWLKELLTLEQQKENSKTAVSEQRVLNGVEAQLAVHKAGGAFWQSIRKWAEEKSLLTSFDRGVLDVASSIPKLTPSDKQSLAILKLLAKLRKEGCTVGLDII